MSPFTARICLTILGLSFSAFFSPGFSDTLCNPHSIIWHRITWQFGTIWQFSELSLPQKTFLSEVRHKALAIRHALCFKWRVLLFFLLPSFSHALYSAREAAFIFRWANLFRAHTNPIVNLSWACFWQASSPSPPIEKNKNSISLHSTRHARHIPTRKKMHFFASPTSLKDLSEEDLQKNNNPLFYSRSRRIEKRFGDIGRLPWRNIRKTRSWNLVLVFWLKICDVEPSSAFTLKNNFCLEEWPLHSSSLLPPSGAQN